MSDQPPPKWDAATRARQGETTGVVRWVLGISLTLVIIGMVVAVDTANSLQEDSDPEQEAQKLSEGNERA